MRLMQGEQAVKGFEILREGNPNLAHSEMPTPSPPFASMANPTYCCWLPRSKMDMCLSNKCSFASLLSPGKPQPGHAELPK